jgi:hypothetical protein
VRKKRAGEDVSPYAATVQQNAYPMSPDELDQMLGKGDVANHKAGASPEAHARMPEAPPARGWFLAVLIVLIVVAAVVVLVLM